ncbi:YhcB family protein [Aliikangiella maris]|uniref:DUF1043 family protein n=2 Tax=Aliikangiella maris TaxID=3162458 RepID=A0ABV2BV20_9GAMM
MEYLYVLITAAVAGFIGFLIGRNISGSVQEKSRLENSLKEKQDELDAFRNKVTNHFEKTADLFNQVSDSYQSLYDHIAKSSNQLCASSTFQLLPQNAKEQQKVSAESLPPTPNPVHEQNTASNQLFDSNRMYNAHEYRNQPKEEDESAEETLDTSKVVDIGSAKEDKKDPAGPALDYAVKAKGVINHNSLNDENVKNQS